jgi:hypothetical protein
MKVGDKVLVIDQRPYAVGVIEKVSDWSKVIGEPASGKCYFVRVQEWDMGTNGGRWLGQTSIREAVNES